MRSQPIGSIGRIALFASSAVLVLGLSACSSDAGTDTGSADGGTSGAASKAGARDAYDVKLAGCLRGRGFDVKDPEPGKGIQESGGGIEAAASICMKELGDPPVSEGRELTPEEAAAEIADDIECLRDRGLEVATPKGSELFIDVPEDATQEDIDTCLAAMPAE